MHIFCRCIKNLQNNNKMNDKWLTKKTAKQKINFFIINDTYQVMQMTVTIMLHTISNINVLFSSKSWLIHFYCPISICVDVLFHYKTIFFFMQHVPMNSLIYDTITSINCMHYIPVNSLIYDIITSINCMHYIPVNSLIYDTIITINHMHHIPSNITEILNFPPILGWLCLPKIYVDFHFEY